MASSCVTKRHTLDFANCWLLVAGDCLFDSVNTIDLVFSRLGKKKCKLNLSNNSYLVEFVLAKVSLSFFEHSFELTRTKFIFKCIKKCVFSAFQFR